MGLFARKLSLDFDFKVMKSVNSQFMMRERSAIMSFGDRKTQNDSL